MKKRLAPLWSVLWPCTVIGVIVVLTCGLEFLMVASDLGLTGSVRWRSLVLQYGGFWPGLMRDWQPNFGSQPWTMFFSYSVLHAGFMHLLGNMLMLLWIGQGLVARTGQIGFALLWLCSALGGAMMFGALTSTPTPMVGASGCVFGLIGAVVVFDYILPGKYAKALGITLTLVVLNIVMLVVEGGLLAWQTHLGGYLTGALAAFVLGDEGPKAAHSER